MPWGLAAAGIAALASHAVAAQKDHKSAKEARSADKRAFMYWRDQQLQQYPLMRQSLEEAGFNPMLAVSNGVSGASGMPSTHQGQTTGYDLVGSAADSAELANKIKDVWRDEDAQREANLRLTNRHAELLSTQIKNLEANTDKTNVDTYTGIADSILPWATTGLGYWLGKGATGSSAKPPPKNIFEANRREYAERMEANSNKGKWKKTFNRYAPWLAPLVINSAKVAVPLGVGAGLGYYIYGDEKRSKQYSDHYKNNYKHNPYMFSPLR